MTVNGKPIAIFTCMQLVAAFLSYAGRTLGGRIVTKLYGESEAAPRITAWHDRLGLLPVLIPLIWFGVVLFRSQRDASNFEMLCWLVLAGLFCFFVGGGGIVAALAPFLSCG